MTNTNDALVDAHHPGGMGGYDPSSRHDPAVIPEHEVVESSATASTAASSSSSYNCSAVAVAVKKSSTASSPTATYNSDYDEDEDEDEDGTTTMPWDRDGWIPTSKSGKQKTPNMIRNELQRYIEKCKADGSSTQTRIVERMGVNNNTFRRFMDPKTYKDQWSAVQNGTYWAGARLLASAELEGKKKKKKEEVIGGGTTTKKGKTTAASAAAAAGGGKRKTVSMGGAADVDDDDDDDDVAKMTKTTTKKAKKGRTGNEKKREAEDLIRRIDAVEYVNGNVVYDTCPEVVAGIKSFLSRDGVNKAMLLSALGGINQNSLARFMGGKGQDQCGNVTYGRAYAFLERLRLLEGSSKSKARLRNEVAYPEGFSLVKERAGKYVFFNPQLRW